MPEASTGTAIVRKSFFVRMLEGVIIGVGAILPGVSGGVLMVVFGLYRPMMEALAHPIDGIKRYGRMFLPVGIGWAVGFLVLAGLLAAFFEKQATIVTALFVGMILGTFPGLFKTGMELKPRKGEWTALAVSTALLLALFFTMKYSFVKTAVTPTFFWFLFAGALWGISLVAPGMTSSPVLLLLGLFQPLAEGIALFDFTVILPFVIGMAAAVLLLTRFVNYLIRRHYSVFYFCILGFVIASTLPIIPLRFLSAGEAILSAGALAAGAALSYSAERLSGGASHAEQCVDEA